MYEQTYQINLHESTARTGEKNLSSLEFWSHLDSLLSHGGCHQHEFIDDALRSYLAVAVSHKGTQLHTESDFERCARGIIRSPIFQANKDYVSRQLLYGLLQEDSNVILHIMTVSLLHDGRQDEITFHMMNDEGVFPRLIELIRLRVDDEAGLYRILLDLLFEVARVQRLRFEDLALIDDSFVTSFLDDIEQLSNDMSDPYLYPVVRVFLVLNEQYMLDAQELLQVQRIDQASTPLTNKFLKILASHGHEYKSFGQSLILLLNREEEVSMQLLILKLLYLVFTSPPTYEYFYTNDLHVLVDIILRNLLDLPHNASTLRHTYLRVLFPMLNHTQLQHPPHEKRNNVLRTLNVLIDNTSDHFDALDDTTARLLRRCKQVEWISDQSKERCETRHAFSHIVETCNDFKKQIEHDSDILQETDISSLNSTNKAEILGQTRVSDLTMTRRKRRPPVPLPKDVAIGHRIPVSHMTTSASLTRSGQQADVYEEEHATGPSRDHCEKVNVAVPISGERRPPQPLPYNRRRRLQSSELNAENSGSSILGGQH